ncbi:MAG TPA: trypsin-like peptidase domain-containing protein [Polyangiaceae bacterium]|nr:trypsin-like peptidase domain-containing protein [Polyangiaceae bacterium]
MSNNAAQDFSNALADAVERVSASVVRVETGRRQPASGLVWSAEGLIVTTAHGLEREQSLEVALESGQVHSAALLGEDPASDLALLRVEATGLPLAERVPKDSLRRGQLVLALTRPGRTVRSYLGVLSALSEQWHAPGGGKLERYIQSDVNVEPGFSGGPLIDAAGRVIGLNSAGLLRGSALALSTLTIERVVNALLSHGQIQRGYLGVSSTAARLPRALAESSGQRAGLVITGLEPNGPAENAGVLLGDVLLSLAGEALESIADLQAALQERASQALPLRMLRAGVAHEISITPGVRA